MSAREDTTLLADYFSLPLPRRPESRRAKLRALIRLNPDNSRAVKWRAELAALNAAARK